MLQLRAFGDSPTASELAEQLRGVPGIRHVAVLAGSEGGTTALTADVRADAADRALSLARGAGIPAEDVSLLRLEVIGPAGAGRGIGGPVLGGPPGPGRAYPPGRLPHPGV